jgi:hypothetical protein
MTIRELIVKITAAIDQAAFEKGRQAAEKVKGALEQTSAQGQSVSRAFGAVKVAVTGLSQDFSGLIAAIEKHKFVLAGLAASAVFLGKSAVDTARSFSNLEFQLKRIADTDEMFKRLQAAIEKTREVSGRFTRLELMQDIREAADESGLAIERIIELLPDLGKIAAAQEESISGLLQQLRNIAATGQIRGKLASIIGVENVIKLRQEFQNLDKSAQDLGLDLEAIAQQKFELTLQAVREAAQKIGKPVSDTEETFRDFRESLEILRLEIGGRILPILTGLTKTVTAFFSALSRIPFAVDALTVALVGLGGAAVVGTALAGIIRGIHLIRDVALGTADVVKNLGIRLMWVLQQSGFEGAALRLAQMFGLAAREGSLFSSIINSLRSVIARFQAGIVSLRAAWAESGTAGVASLISTRTAALATSASVKGIALAANVVKAAMLGLATAGRAILRLLGPIAAVIAAYEGLMWVIDKVWKKLSGAEAIERANKALIAQAVETLEKSRPVLAEKMRALGEEQREALEEEFAKIPASLMTAAQELGAEDFLKLNVNTKPVRDLIVEVRKGKDDVESLKAELSKLITGKDAFEGITQEARKAAVNLELVRQKIQAAFPQRFFAPGMALSEVMELQPIWKQIDEAIKGVDVLQKAINQIGAMPALELRVKREGVGWLKELAEKIRREKPTVEEAAKELAQAIADYIPQSPAKKGPLSRLNEVGPAFAKTVAASLSRARETVASAVQAVLPKVAQLPEATQEITQKVQYVKVQYVFEGDEAVPSLIQKVRRVFEGEGPLPELTQKIRRVFEGDEAMPSLTQRVRRVFEGEGPLPEFIQQVKRVPTGLADMLAPMPTVSTPALAFSTGPISVNVSISGATGLDEKTLGTEIARQTGYELWKQIRPHWEEAMFRIFRSFKKHEAPDIKGVTP